MTAKHSPPTYKGRYMGVVALVSLQLLVGLIHVIFGFWLLSASRTALFSNESFTSDVYSFYTIVFGIVTLAFAAELWMEKRWGWLGSVGVALFVTAADSLTLLDLPSVPGIPKFAGYGEIMYSVVVLFYLAQTHIRVKYQISKI